MLSTSHHGMMVLASTTMQKGTMMTPNPPKQPPSLRQALPGLVILGIVIVACVWGGIAAANQSSSDQAVADARSTKTAAVRSTETATIKLTPTVPPTLEQTVAAAIAHQAIVASNPDGGAGTNGGLWGRLQNVASDGPDTHPTDITVTVDYTSTDLITKTQIEDDVYEVLRAVYHGTSLNPGKVDVLVMGPVQDAYGNTSTGLIAHATLMNSTATLFNWDNLFPSQAWNVYDYQWFIKGL